VRAIAAAHTIFSMTLIRSSCARARLLALEFAFRRISRIDVRVLSIQIEHHWQDIAASAAPLPCAD
jgi:hypothetical protein